MEPRDLNAIDLLLSIPPAAVRAGAVFPAYREGPACIASDPPGSQLGSGGGTVHLLLTAWRASGIPAFSDWLAASRKLLLHGSGQSRRLPAYAAEGKPLLPLPLLPDVTGQPLDQRLLDAQQRVCRQIYAHAPATYRLMIACGDVLLRNDSPMPPFPEADILIVGIQASPEEACHHGVLFCEPQRDHGIEFFLQKPSPDTIRGHSTRCEVFLDTGVWLFSERAITALLRLCHCDPAVPGAAAGAFELFDRFGPALGRRPAEPHPVITPLTAATLPLPTGRFYHFGTNRSLVHSVSQLLAPAEARRSFGHAAPAEGHALPPVNSRLAGEPPRGANCWIESSVIPADWRLRHDHCLTAVPDNAWALDLPAGACLDCVPVVDDPRLCLRVYGFDDAFRGALGDPGTCWLGRPFARWLERRGLDFEACGLDPAADIQHAPLFPLADPTASGTAGLLSWMLAGDAGDEAGARAWTRARRLSAAELLIATDVARRQAIRQDLQRQMFNACTPQAWAEQCVRVDLEQMARAVAQGACRKPPPPAGGGELAPVHHQALLNRLGQAEPAAAALLRDQMMERLAINRSRPARTTLDDQIVWGRSPVRLDLAGGWTDTPPYCLEHGGRVVNLAADLNGQPPIQVFARICAEPHIVLKSIDLGISETVTTFAELGRSEPLGSGFAIGRTALRLAGFSPEFHEGTAAPDLKRLLERAFGGGIEINMLAAVPKGSGLGTSSILAATILGTLSDLCGLKWTSDDLYLRTLVLEQMLGSGGGWQDQVGGIAAGLKRIESTPGHVQRPVVHWLPEAMLADAIRDQRMLLYYTGITRVAHNILGEIVNGIFLNDARRIAIIDAIGQTADFATRAMQRQDWEGLCEAVRRSWQLNQALDSGTNPPAIQDILEAVDRDLAAAKLLGAGGGGYVLMLARDSQAAASIRRKLTRHPPNPRARFVTPSLSATGLQVTRS